MKLRRSWAIMPPILAQRLCHGQEPCAGPAVSEVGPRIPAERCRDGNLRPFVGWAYLREEPLGRWAGRKMGRGDTATNRARTPNRSVARVLGGASAGIERPGRA